MGALVAVAGWLWLSSSGRPQRQGEAPLPGLTAAVQVRWDRWGVPHLSGATATDLAAATGWLHANDRFTQMEVGRRTASGRLSEVFGRDALVADAYFRRLQIRAAVAAMWRRLEGESRRWLEAYARGVNAWLAQRDRDLPPGLRLLEIDPEPWRPEDSLSFIYLMGNTLSYWQGRPEEERFVWLRYLGEERTRDLVGEEELFIPPATLALARRPGAARGETEARPPGSGGSNSWAVAPDRSRTGTSLVANDPHLRLGLPATWYQLHLRAPDLAVGGMSLPGLPGVIIGQSRDLAWALTNHMLDDHDLYLEILDDEGERVRRGDGWLPVDVAEEVVSLPDGEMELVTVRLTDRGPLLEAEPERGLPPRSLAWTLYLPADPLQAFLGLARAQSLEQAREATTAFVGPAQNLVVAHRGGGLLYTVMGRVPERRRGDGRLPVPGWSPEYGWDGLRPASEELWRLSPEDGFVVTANNDIRPAGEGRVWAADFETPHRMLRIRQLLAAGQRWTVGGMAELQLDVTSLYAREVVDLLEGEYEGDAGRAYGALVGWDGEMDLRGTSALFALVERQLGQGIFGDEARAHDLRPLGNRQRLLRVLQGDMEPAWFDDVATAEHEERPTIVQRALSRAWDEGQRRWGDDVAGWRYGDLHALDLTGAVGRLPLVGRWWNRGPFPVAGSATTVAAYYGRWQDEAFQVIVGPSMRWVTDAADPDACLAVIPGGQSGHPGDPHYDDQLELFLQGEMRRVQWSEAAIRGATVSTLRLVP